MCDRRERDIVESLLSLLDIFTLYSGAFVHSYNRYVANPTCNSNKFKDMREEDDVIRHEYSDAKRVRDLYSRQEHDGCVLFYAFCCRFLKICFFLGKLFSV